MIKSQQQVRRSRSRLQINTALSLLLLFVLFNSFANAQRERRDEGRNNNARDNASRQNTVREQTPRIQHIETRRNEVFQQHGTPSRDFNRIQTPVNTDRTIKRDRANENTGVVRDRGNYPGRGNDNRPREMPNNNANNRPEVNHDRNNNPNTVRREGNIYSGQSRPAERRESYTRERPGERPEYRYDRQPLYNRFEPCWRYNSLPRRNSYYYSLPYNYNTINYGGFGYRYWDGVFYRPYNNLFSVCAPPIGIFIDILPIGYRRIYVRDYPYYYYNGTYYDQRGSGYTVVSPPVGAVVESLPAGYDTIYIDGETYYTVDGAQYKPVVQENGEIWYEVVRAN